MASDLHLLARVFIRYRSGLDTNYPECQEIIALLNHVGLDVMSMNNPDILAAVGGEVGSETLPTAPEKPRGRRKSHETAVIADDFGSEPSEENEE